jgi:hypothetical protein
VSRPLARFLVFGALAFSARGAMDALHRGWADGTATGEAAAARAGTGDDEALFEQAVALGLDETDPVVYRRLVANLRFLEPATHASDATLAREAHALGMHRTDPVARRRLVNVMRLRLEADARTTEPSEDELGAHLAAHADRWREPARVRLDHVFFSEARRGDAAGPDAARALAALRADADDPSGGQLVGDAFPEDVTTGLRSERELARILGPAIARAAFDLAVDAWSAPVLSVYGAHLLRVRERAPAILPPLDAVRASVREDLLTTRGGRG